LTDISSWCWLTPEGEAVLSGCRLIVRLADVVEVAAVDDADEEHWSSHSWNSLNRDSICGSHVHLHESIVLVSCLVCKTEVRLTKFKIFVCNLFLIFPSCWRLTESEHVEDILALRQEIVKAEIRSQSHVESTKVSAVLFVSVYGNGIVEVVLACVEMLWIGVPSGVEENAVEHDVSEEDACSVFFSGPPWLERVEALAIFIGYVRKCVSAIANFDSIFQLFVVCWTEDVLESDQDFGVNITVDTEIDWTRQVDRITVIEQNLIIWLEEAGL
jgi:hypothetical protein